MSLFQTIQGGLTAGDKWTVKITSAGFAPVSRGEDTFVALVFDAVSEPTLPDWCLSLTVGAGWQIGAGGMKIEWASSNKGKPGFSASSRYGEFLDAVGKCAPDFVKNVETSGRDADQAAIWVGTEWVFEAIDTGRLRDDKDPAKGNIIHALPVKLISASGGSVPAAPATGAAPTPPAAGTDAEAMIIQLAKSLPDHTAWFQALTADPKLMAYIQSTGNLTHYLDGGPGGFHAKHKQQAS